MGTTIALVLIAILIALIAMSRRGEKATSKQAPVQRRTQSIPNSQFHAVSIQFTDGACAAAKNSEGKRFLATAAPHLPLPDCDAPACSCRFVHHNDRRSGMDRRGQYVPAGLANEAAYSGRERRYRGDRRGNEPQNFFT